MSGPGSTESEEMSVEDENRNNAESDDIRLLLSTFMDAKEETLEELVGGLMYLTMGKLVGGLMYLTMGKLVGGLTYLTMGKLVGGLMYKLVD
jgi:hypothetical protein